MAQFVVPIVASLIAAGGTYAASASSTSATKDTAKKARATQQSALDKQRETLEAEKARDEGELARAYRAPRGRRLLLAATGEEGLSSTLG